MIAAALGAVLLVGGWFDVLWAQNAMFDLQAAAHSAEADRHVLPALANLYTAGHYGVQLAAIPIGAALAADHRVAVASRRAGSVVLSAGLAGTAVVAPLAVLTLRANPEYARLLDLSTLADGRVLSAAVGGLVSCVSWALIGVVVGARRRWSSRAGWLAWAGFAGLTWCWGVLVSVGPLRGCGPALLVPSPTTPGTAAGLVGADRGWAWLGVGLVTVLAVAGVVTAARASDVLGSPATHRRRLGDSER
ncbi:hypothetical protein GA0070606_0398 [Micromonospora citrea]|uniref:Uncharacterized protein n=2 Tax=Micromonospora citrea TaxID=47855 RepID=A0A1C6TS91_9ACTN|nr:hypothetical protein GA0070606_0398 [Micromonospora citrea]